MGHELFGKFLARQTWHVFEPAWKALCNNKALLLVLQELFPNHPNLLPVSRDAGAFKSYARKPILGREGSNLQLVVDGQELSSTSGPYEDDSFIYQQFAPLVRNGKNYAQLGVWMIGDEARGLGVREDDIPILRSSSRFVPHIII
jgi:glutathionylspermidine synthase